LTGALCQVDSGNEITGSTIDEIPSNSGNGSAVKIKLDPHCISLACEFPSATSHIIVVADNAPADMSTADRLAVIMPIASKA
jgi:hypothetical protein